MDGMTLALAGAFGGAVAGGVAGFISDLSGLMSLSSKSHTSKFAAAGAIIGAIALGAGVPVVKKAFHAAAVENCVSQTPANNVAVITNNPDGTRTCSYQPK